MDNETVTRPSLADAMREAEITFEIEPGAFDERLFSQDRAMDGWTYTFTRAGRTMTGSYWTGVGHRKPTRYWPSLDWQPPWTPKVGWKNTPTAEGVMNCLLRDASTWVQARDFDDFCEELGYAPHASSERYEEAKRIWEACGQEYKNLIYLLGSDLLDHLMYGVESE